MDEFIHQITKSLEANTFVKITLSSPMHKDAEVRNIYAKQVEIKGERKLSFTYRRPIRPKPLIATFTAILNSS